MLFKLQNKINAYNKAYHLAIASKNTVKAKQITNKIHQFDYQLWQVIKGNKTTDTLRFSKLPQLNYTNDVFYHDIIINSLFLPGISRARINKLVRSKNVITGNYPTEIGGYNRLATPCRIGNRPEYEHVDTNNYFNIERALVPKYKHKRKKTHYTIVRKHKGHIQRKRYKIEKRDYIMLTNQIPGYKPAVLITTRKDNTVYLTVDTLKHIVEYFESFTVWQLYQERIRSYVVCINCGCDNRRKNKLTS